MKTSTFRGINLDAASDSSLRRIARNDADPRRHLVKRMLEARRARLRGNIDLALHLERCADEEIRGLPAALRW